MELPIHIFKDRVTLFSTKRTQLNETHNKLSTLRIAIFLGAVIALVYFANERNFYFVFGILLVFPFVFGVLIKHHNKIKYKRDHHSILSLINEEEILKQEGDLKKFYNGIDFSEPNHPYAADLDIFGSNSLYQLLNRGTMWGSKELLANWLKSAAENEEIKKRQEAVAELTPQLEWRQEFQAGGRHFEEEGENLQALVGWINDDSLMPKLKRVQILMVILPLLSVSAILAWIIWDVHYLVPTLFAIINAVVLLKFNADAKDATDRTYKGVSALKSYGKLIELIENKEFASEKLATMKHSFSHPGFKASDEINKLRQILDYLMVRNNAYYHIFNVVFVLDLFSLVRGERWKLKSRKYIKAWFEAIHEIEVINSLAGFQYANPDYTIPFIESESHLFQAESLGHPLLKRNIRINNDFNMSGKGKIVIITGSNMAGKSTFLRTVGVNAVLALMGAPVCASTLKVSNTQIFTSMRTEDNLEESVSSFYAELKRLKQLITFLETGKPVLFMLDEILKGTNSHDRHSGALALIRQLHTQNASGFVSTHDVELGKIKDEIPEIENYSFNSEIIEDEIIFDYKVTPGICKTFNASKLMSKMGIKI